MTNKQALISQTIKEYDLPEGIVTEAFDKMFERDWKIFCSYMADDRDHPEEREAANEAFDKWYWNCEEGWYRESLGWAIFYIERNPLYKNAFHTMNEEFKGDAE